LKAFAVSMMKYMFTEEDKQSFKDLLKEKLKEQEKDF